MKLDHLFPCQYSQNDLYEWAAETMAGCQPIFDSHSCVTFVLFWIGPATPKLL